MKICNGKIFHISIFYAPKRINLPMQIFNFVSLQSSITSRWSWKGMHSTFYIFLPFLPLEILSFRPTSVCLPFNDANEISTQKIVTSWNRIDEKWMKWQHLPNVTQTFNRFSSKIKQTMQNTVIHCDSRTNNEKGQAINCIKKENKEIIIVNLNSDCDFNYESFRKDALAYLT